MKMHKSILQNKGQRASSTKNLS